jgi:lipopolysaccharide transport system permease protein
MAGTLVRLRHDVREMVREQITYADLLHSLVRRDLAIRYKQSLMGFGWAIAMPVMNTIIFSVIFMRVAPLDPPWGLPYPLFAYAGLLPWNFTASSLKFAVVALTANTALVTKVYFAREVLPFAAIMVSLVDFAVASLVLAGLMVYYGFAPGWTIAFLPVILLVQIALTAGVALLLSMANLFFRDIKYLFDIVLTFWMFATSVVYPVEYAGGRLATILSLNPMTPIIDGYRAVLLGGTLPDPARFAYAATVAFVLLGIGWLQFHRAEFRFAEKI